MKPTKTITGTYVKMKRFSVLYCYGVEGFGGVITLKRIAGVKPGDKIVIQIFKGRSKKK